MTRIRDLNDSTKLINLTIEEVRLHSFVSKVVARVDILESIRGVWSALPSRDRILLLSP